MDWWTNSPFYHTYNLIFEDNRSLLTRPLPPPPSYSHNQDFPHAWRVPCETAPSCSPVLSVSCGNYHPGSFKQFSRAADQTKLSLPCPIPPHHTTQPTVPINPHVRCSTGTELVSDRLSPLVCLGGGLDNRLSLSNTKHVSHLKKFYNISDIPCPKS